MPPTDPTPKTEMPGAEFTVSWGYDVAVSVALTPRNWARVLRGNTLRIRGKGYRYEGEFFWDYWTFTGGLHGDVLVEYGEDGAVGFDGAMSEAFVRNSPKR